MLLRVNTTSFQSCIGGRSLGWDLLPPGSPEEDYTDPKTNKTITYAGYVEERRGERKIIYCALCAVRCALCAVCCAPCAVCCVLCAVRAVWHCMLIPVLLFFSSSSSSTRYHQSPEKWTKGTTPKPIGWMAGEQYDGDTADAAHILANIGDFYPGATEYEIKVCPFRTRSRVCARTHTHTHTLSLSLSLLICTVQYTHTAGIQHVI